MTRVDYLVMIMRINFELIVMAMITIIIMISLMIMILMMIIMIDDDNTDDARKTEASVSCHHQYKS